MKLDEIDARLLRELERDGRASHVRLAERVGLSPSAVSRRIAELERAGAIAGYRAVVAPPARGGGFTVLVAVGLSEHTRAQQEHFERAMSRAWQVRECHNITGAWEYMLRVEVPDLAAFREFHADVLGKLPQVRQLTSHVVMASPKDERA